MMAVTHGLIGLLLAITSIAIWPEMIFYAALGGYLGGIFPDLDLAFNHRKTFHFPVIFSISTLMMGLIIILYPSIVSIAVFYFFLSAAIHSWIDIFGGGLEARPWIPSDDRGVYSHTLEKWFKPKRWIRYDGSPEDLLLSTLIAIPCYLFYSNIFQDLVVLTLLTGGIYTILRKKIVDWAPDRFV